MTERRQSARSSAVKERELLEEKLVRRKQAEEVKAQKKRSKALQDLYSQELETFEEEALRLSRTVDELYTSAPDNESSDNQSQKSLEWDNSGNTTPSFLSDRTSSLPDRTQSVVEDIIHDILDLGSFANYQDDIPEPSEPGPSVRRHTSTNEKFLEEAAVPAVTSVPVPVPGLDWPPRFPSQEPEDFQPFETSSVNLHLPPPIEELDSEVFEYSKMDDTEYKGRLKAVKVAISKAKDTMKTFVPEVVTDMHVSTHQVRLGEIREKLAAAQELATELMLDLEDSDHGEEERTATVQGLKDNLLQEILTNEARVLDKIKQLKLAQPITKAEQEDLDLKRKKMEQAEEKEKTLKEENKLKVEIDIEDVVDRATTLMEILNKVDDAKKLTDLQIREALVESKKWETKFDEIKISKVKIDKNVVGLDVSKEKKDRYKDQVQKTSEILKAKIAELKREDSEKALFSLSKPVKEDSLYPKPFGGTKGEDVYKFRQKFLEAIEANQVSEKHKVEVLRKHLRGTALDNTGDHFASLDLAMKNLVESFGQAELIWSEKLEKFSKKCNDAKLWKKGEYSRVTVISNICEFLREADKLVVDHPELEQHIYVAATVKKVISVLPPEMQVDYLKTCSKIQVKEQLEEIRTFLQKEHILSRKLVEYKEEIGQAQANFGSLKSQARSQNLNTPPEESSYHDCLNSGLCMTEWGVLGCVKLYELATVQERIKLMRKKMCCFSCGRSRKKNKQNHVFNQQTNKVECKSRNVAMCAPAKCKEATCKFGAAICTQHAPNNAKQELLDWIRKNKIKTTVTAIIMSPPVGSSLPGSSNKSNSTRLPPNKTKFTKQQRSRLQEGDMCVPFCNDELKDFFINDLNNKGHQVSKEDMIPVPEGDTAFVFCKIKGKKSGIQAFIDSGANCCIMADGIPQRELDSCKLQDGPINIDVATGLVVHASGEWGCTLPLADGSFQVLRGLTVPRVTSDMPRMKLKPWFDKVKTTEPGSGNKEIQNITIPSELGGFVDMILGISFTKVHPVPVHTFPDGLTIYKSKFLPVNPGELACIGGPMASINMMVSNVGARSAIRNLANMCSNISAGYSPKLEFFPSSPQEMERNFHKFVDKQIPFLYEFLEVENEGSIGNEDEDLDDQACEESGEDYGSQINQIDENEVDSEEKDELDELSVPGVTCSDCKAIVMCSNQSFAVQAELKRFLQQQDAGLDCSFRCMRCRDCKLCLKGAGEERKSMMEEAHQEIIRQSVYIDQKLGRAVAKLPFIENPAGKLNNNTRLASKRLDNVCRKYGDDDKVREMINHSFDKLFTRGHIVYLDDLPPEIQMKIKNAKASYTIPYDVAFKEGSISTPARPVFDASSKTPGGDSLNNLLAKGSSEMVRLIDMMLDWRMGKSALTGDIRQFYNNVLLHPDHWQFQKILLKKNLDPEAKLVTAIIKTLIYGVKPVGNQCDEVIKLLAEEIWEEYPEVAKMLVYKRYVDDFGQSTPSMKATEELIEKTTKVLAKIKMEVKGWVIAGKIPPPEASDDGISVGFAGLTWFPAGDFFKLNIQSLHFAKKKRGKFPPGLIKYDKAGEVSIEEYTPKLLTRTNCTSVTARIFDITGLVAPVTLKMKYYLRKLISHEPSWTKPIPDHQRQIWVNLFKTVEDIRDILYLRCSIPSDALSCKARLLLLCDAADIGIIMGVYVCYPRPNSVWSCDLLFGKGLLAQENWTIPCKELHALSALSNLKVVLENCLGNWIESFSAFSDSEIALCWAIYEKVKLTTFVRNRVINIRSKMGLEILNHVDGKENACDTGTRPDLITAESVRPGSTWLTGCKWMKESLEKARNDGIIKSVEDIKLSNEKKKIFKEGIAYDTFDEVEQGIFAVAQVEKVDSKKMSERFLVSDYIYHPLKRSLKSVVRITALVLLVAHKWKRALRRKQVDRGEIDKEELKKIDFLPPKFTVFSLVEHKCPEEDSENKLSKYFAAHDVLVQNYEWNNAMWNAAVDKPTKTVHLNEEHLSAALEDIFKRATKEVIEFHHKKDIDKIATMSEGILYYNSRILEEAELRVVGHLADTISVEQFTGVNFRVPLVDQHSPLAYSVALHLHYHKYPHRGAETLHRMSLQFAKILGGRKIFSQVSADCQFCKKMRKKTLDQMMGPLSQPQLSISPVFYFTLADLWGPLQAFVPGYEKVTRSSQSKPHEVYILVLACCSTGTVNCQVLEGKDSALTMDGLNRFFMETTVPKFIYSDEEGGLVKALKHGRADLMDLSGTLSRQRGIRFETVVPQGHYGHGRIEKRIHMLQQSLEKSEIRNSRCTSMGWHTLAKAIERTVNSVPIGFLHHESGGINPLLRILTPNSLRLISTSDRSPVGLFNIPDNASNIMNDIQKKYEAWYHVWNEQYIPLVMNRQKWHFRKENLCQGDIVYFKLKESKMSATWRIGKVEEVKVGKDGYVRQAVIAYKDTSADDVADWVHRTIERPARNIVKLFNIDDTTLMDDLNEVYKLSKKLLDQEKLSHEDIEDEKVPTNNDDEVVFDENPKIRENIEFKNEEKMVEKVPMKRKTELEKLKIDMEGWNMLTKDTMMNPTPKSMQAVMRAASPFIHNFVSTFHGNSAEVVHHHHQEADVHVPGHSEEHYVTDRLTEQRREKPDTPNSGTGENINLQGVSEKGEHLGQVGCGTEPANDFFDVIDNYTTADHMNIFLI